MDQHGMKFVMDTTGVAKGFRDYRAAVDGIFASLSKFEAHVDKTMKGVAKATSNPQALNAFKKSVAAFARVDIDTQAARKLSTLSAAMSGFKAPTAGQTANTRRFFTTLSRSLPDLGNAYKAIKAIEGLKSAMNGFRAPPASASKNLSSFASAMQKAVPAFNSIRNVSGLTNAANGISTLTTSIKSLRAPSASQVANLSAMATALRSFNFSNLSGSGNFYATLGAISAFRAPSAAQIRNLQEFVNAVARMRVPANANAVADALNKIASAANRAGLSMRNFRGGMGGLGGSLGGVSSQARGATIQMMGLQNAFSATFQAGSVLRSLLGSLTIAELGRNFFEATNAAIQFEAQMGVLNKSTGFAGQQLNYVNQTANAFGTDMLAASTGFAKISIAASKSGVDVMATRHIFEGMTTAMTVLGTTTAGQGDVWLALQQVMNKGYLSAEELNQQLNEKLPGAMAYAGEYAAKLGVTLEEGLKTKVLDAAGVLSHIATRMKEDFGPSVASALDRPAAQMNILRNNVNLLFQAIGQSGGNEAFGDLLKSINERMRPEDIQRYAQAIGEGLKSAVDKVSAAFNFLYENWDSIKGPLATTLSLMGKWMLLTGSLQIARFIVQPLLSIGPALGGLRTAGILMTTLTATTRFGAMRAMVGLTGTSRTAALGILALRAQMTGLITSARAGTLSVAGMTTAIRALGASAATAVGGGLRALVAMLGGPIILGLAAAAYGVYQLSEAYNDNQSAIAQSNDFLESNRAKVAAATASIGLHTQATATNDMMQRSFSTTLGLANGFLDTFKAKMDAATGGLWSMAEAARAATIESLKLAQADVTKNMASLQVKSKDELGKLASLQTREGEYGNAALTQLYRGGVALAQFTGFSPSEKKVNDQIKTLRNQYDKIGKDIKAAEQMSNEDIRKHLGQTGFGVQPPKPKPTETESGAAKKAKSARDMAETLENSVDQLMRKMQDHDPVGKLYTDFVKTLTDQAQVLLNDKGYKTFIQNIGKEADAGKVTVQSLIDTLQNGGNVSQSVMKDLKTRYGEDVNGIIDMLKAQQAAYEDAVKETTIKGLDIKFKAIAKGMDTLGDSIPALAEARENMDALTAMGRMAFAPGEGFNKWITELKSGVSTADIALEELIKTMGDPKLRSADFSNFLSSTGTSEEEVITAIRRKMGAQADARREAEIDLQLGERLLQQGRDEILLLAAGAREGQIYSTVQQEVNRLKAIEGPISQERIKLLTEEVRAQQNLADQMKRNREFFENNGVRSYINDLQQAGAAINDLDKNFLQSLEDQLFSIGTTGKFSFKAIFDTIQQGLVRFASQGLIQEGLKGLFGQEQLEGGTPSIFGKLFGAMGFNYAPEQAGKLGESAANPLYVTWAGGPLGVDGLNGNIFSGSNARNVTLVDDVQSQTKTALGSAITDSAQLLKQEFGSATNSFGGMLQMLIGSLSGGGGAGGLAGGLLSIGMSLFGGGGPSAALNTSAQAAIAANPGIFKEGGYPGAPVARASIHPSAFTNAPHYSEGTPNTSGGHPAILHDNEAVIPLSRGRKVPVELAGGGSRGQVINNNWHITTPDVGGFRRSNQQIAANMHMQAGRAYRRNN